MLLIFNQPPLVCVLLVTNIFVLLFNRLTKLGQPRNNLCTEIFVTDHLSLALANSVQKDYDFVLDSPSSRVSRLDRTARSVSQPRGKRDSSITSAYGGSEILSKGNPTDFPRPFFPLCFQTSTCELVETFVVHC